MNPLPRLRPVHCVCAWSRRGANRTGAGRLGAPDALVCSRRWMATVLGAALLAGTLGVALPAAGAQSRPVDTVVIANGWSAADSAVASAVAAARSSAASPAVVLYSTAKDLSPRTRGFIESRNPRSVVLVGGTEALSANVASAVQSLTGSAPERITGGDRYETAANAVPPTASVFIVANGHSSADTGVAAALAAVTRDAAVLLSSATSLTDVTERVIAERGPRQVIFVGGIEVLARSLADRVRELAPSVPPVSRRSGISRTETAAAAAPDWTKTLVIANGWSPADTGVAAALAAVTSGAAVLYSQRNALTDPTADRIAELQPNVVVLVGGAKALGTALHRQIHCLAPGVEMRRISGSDRIDTAARAAEGTQSAIDFDFDCGEGGGGGGGSGGGGGGSSGGGGSETPSGTPYSDPTLASQYHDPEPYPGASPIHDLALKAPNIGAAAYNPALWDWTNRVWKLNSDKTTTDVTAGVGDSETNFCLHVGVPAGDPCDWHLNWALYTCQQIAAGTTKEALTKAVLDMMTWVSGRPNGTERRVRVAVAAGVRTCTVSPQSAPVASIWDFDAADNSSHWSAEVASRES